MTAQRAALPKTCMVFHGIVSVMWPFWSGINDFTYLLFMMSVAAMMVISVAVMFSMSVMITGGSVLNGDFSVY